MARPTVTELGPLVQKGEAVPREPVALPTSRVIQDTGVPQANRMPQEPVALATTWVARETEVPPIRQVPEPLEPDADLLARYRREPKVLRETVSVKITQPTLRRLDAFIGATQAQRQAVWEDAVVQFLEKVGF